MKREKKTEQILIRLTPTEKRQITEKAAAAHISVSGYLAKLSEDKKIISVENLPQLIVQITKIGTNINQIAYIGNSQRVVHKELLLAVVNQMEEVKKIMIRILKAVYDENEHSVKTLEKKIDKLIEKVDTYGNG